MEQACASPCLFGTSSCPWKAKPSTTRTPGRVLWVTLMYPILTGPLRLRVQSRSRTRSRVAASIAFLFRACFKGVLDTIAPPYSAVEPPKRFRMRRLRTLTCVCVCVDAICPEFARNLPGIARKSEFAWTLLGIRSDNGPDQPCAELSICQGAPKERRRGRAEKRLSKRVFLESPFFSAPLRFSLKTPERS